MNNILKVCLIALAPVVLVVAAYAEWSTPTDEYGKFVGPGQIKSAGYTTAAIGTTAISDTLAPGRTFELIAIRATVTDIGDGEEDGNVVGQSANLTVTIDSSLGAAYDHLLFSEDISTLEPGIMMTFSPPIPFVATDELDIAYDGTAGGAGTDQEALGVELLYRYIGAAP